MRRIEREWVPVKLYLPTTLYAQLLTLIEHDSYYQAWVTKEKYGSSETEMNAAIRIILDQWFEHQGEIEAMSGTKAQREEWARTELGRMASMDS